MTRRSGRLTVAKVYYNDSTKAGVMQLTVDGKDPERVLNLKDFDPNASYCAFVETTWDGSLLIHCWSGGGESTG